MLLNINYIQYEPIKRVVICITMILLNYVYILCIIVYAIIVYAIYLLTPAVECHYTIYRYYYGPLRALSTCYQRTVVCIYYTHACV